METILAVYAQIKFSDAVRNQDKASALIAMAKAGKTQRGLVLDYTLNNMKHIQQIFDGVDIGRYLKVRYTQIGTFNLCFVGASWYFRDKS